MDSTEAAVRIMEAVLPKVNFDHIGKGLLPGQPKEFGDRFGEIFRAIHAAVEEAQTPSD